VKLIDKYIVKEFSVSFLALLGIFIFIYIIIDLFSMMDELVKRSVSLIGIMKYYAFLVPAIFVRTAPVANLIAVLHVLGELNRHNEISTIKASGINLWRVIIPLLSISVVISLLVFSTGEKLVPGAYAGARHIRQEKITGSTWKSRIVGDLTYYGENKLFHIRQFDKASGTMKDVTIIEYNEDKSVAAKITAKTGLWSDGEWKFYSVSIYRYSAGIPAEGSVFYPEMTMDVPATQEDFLKGELETEFMSSADLKANIKHLSTGGYYPREEWVDYHLKIAFPFVGPAMVLAGIPFGLVSRRGGALVGIGAGIILGIVCYGVLAISIALGKGGIFPPVISAWLSNFLFGGTGIIMICRTRT
jgi:lipopolysaccharide export system permease protein